MRYAAGREEMQAVDACSISEYGIPGIVLMEKAAMAMESVFLQCIPEDKKIVIVTEKGNNGGDGLALSRLLAARGRKVAVYEIGAINAASESYLIQKNILEKLGIPLEKTLPLDGDVYVDAIFGVGLKREVTGIHAQVIEIMNQLEAMRVAVDVPSGVDAGTGQVLGVGFKADLTITFGLHKVGLLLYPGASLAGQVKVCDIGFPAAAVEKISPRAYYYEPDDLKGLPARNPWSNKGSYGKVLVVAGQKNMAGASVLAGRAAYRSGCGLVRIFTPEENRQIVQSLLPDAILTTWQDQDSRYWMDQLKEACSWADTIIIGPGMGRSLQAAEQIKTVLGCAKVPLVIDADGLNSLAVMLSDDTDKCLYEEYPAAIILTPHLMEMSRLTGMSVSDIKQDLIGTADILAGKDRVVVLKDARTIVAGCGEKIYINVSGNHGLAVGGSGDVLTGMIGAFLAGGLSPRKAAELAVYCHGLAGGLFSRTGDPRSMMASDIPELLGKVFDMSRKDPKEDKSGDL